MAAECLGAGISLPHLLKEQFTVMLYNPQSNTARPEVLGFPSIWRPETGPGELWQVPRSKWQVRGGDCLKAMAESRVAQARVRVCLDLWTLEAASVGTQEVVVPG